MTEPRPYPTELPVQIDTDWHADAACRDYPSDVFFPTDRYDPTLGKWIPPTSHAITIAKSICNVCTVRDTCLDAALQRNELYGIWGGMTTKERRKARRERGITKRLICRHCRTEFSKPGDAQYPSPYCSRACQKAASNRHCRLNRPIEEGEVA